MSWKVGLLIAVLAAALSVTVYKLKCEVTPELDHVDYQAETDSTYMDPVRVIDNADLVMPDINIDKPSIDWTHYIDSLCYELKVASVKVAIQAEKILAARDSIKYSQARFDSLLMAISMKASTDTTLEGHGHLDVTYFFPPANKFDLLFTPAPKERIIETRWLKPEPLPWYKTQKVGFGMGVFSTAALVYLIK